MTTFYLIRHGQTDWNKNRVLQGQTDIELNALGEQQAKELAEALKDINFDLAFSSDLLRARKTAEIIVLEKNLIVEVTKLLRERSFGRYEGGPTDAILAYTKLVQALDKEERSKHRMAEDVESDEELTTRLVTFLRETAITHPDKTILVGSHGGLLRMLLLHTGYFTYEELDKLTLINGAYIKFRSDGVDFFIDEVVGIKPRSDVPESL